MVFVLIGCINNLKFILQTIYCFDETKNSLMAFLKNFYDLDKDFFGFCLTESLIIINYEHSDKFSFEYVFPIVYFDGRGDDFGEKIKKNGKSVKSCTNTNREGIS